MFFYKDFKINNKQSSPLAMLVLRYLNPEEYPIHVQEVVYFDEISIASTPDIVTIENLPERFLSNTPDWFQKLKFKFW